MLQSHAGNKGHKVYSNYPQKGQYSVSKHSSSQEQN